MWIGIVPWRSWITSIPHISFLPLNHMDHCPLFAFGSRYTRGPLWPWDTHGSPITRIPRHSRISGRSWEAWLSLESLHKDM